MLRRLFALCLLVCCVASFVGCGPSVKDKLAGKWQGKLTLDQAAVDKKKAEASNPIEAMAAEMLFKSLAENASLVVELNADGTMTQNLSAGLIKQSSSGKWELKSVDGNNVVLLLKESKGDKDMPITLDPDFLSGTGGFVVDSPDMTQGVGSIKFTRQ